MEIETFEKITRNVISQQGFDTFLPTLLLTDKNEIFALEGAPDDKEEIISWAKNRAEGQKEFLEGQFSEGLYYIKKTSC